jgi:hypothetical protein
LQLVSCNQKKFAFCLPEKYYFASHRIIKAKYNSSDKQLANSLWLSNIYESTSEKHVFTLVRKVIFVPQVEKSTLWFLVSNLPSVDLLKKESIECLRNDFYVSRFTFRGEKRVCEIIFVSRFTFGYFSWIIDKF